MGPDDARVMRRTVATETAQAVGQMLDELGVEFKTIAVLISDNESTAAVYTASGKTSLNSTEQDVGVLNLSMLLNAVDHLVERLGISRKIVADIISGIDTKSPLAQRISGQRTARRPSGRRGRPR